MCGDGREGGREGAVGGVEGLGGRSQQGSEKEGEQDSWWAEGSALYC